MIWRIFFKIIVRNSEIKGCVTKLSYILFLRKKAVVTTSFWAADSFLKGVACDEASFRVNGTIVFFGYIEV